MSIATIYLTHEPQSLNKQYFRHIIENDLHDATSNNVLNKLRNNRT